MRLGDTKLKSLVSAIFVGILLFNYVAKAAVLTKWAELLAAIGVESI